MKNEVIIEGVLFKTPKLKRTPQGRKMTQFRIENIVYLTKDDEDVENMNPISCELWYELAERAVTILKEGDMVQVVGELRTNKKTKELFVRGGFYKRIARR